MRVYCDFDGTISIEDATDFILARLADPEWEVVERQWQDGLIGSGDCMRRQIALLRAKQQELDEVLEDVVIDPTFPSFVEFCANEGLPLTIVSDGVDYFINRILARHQLDHLPVIANKLIVGDFGGHASYRLSSPYSDPECLTAAGVCKCRSLTLHDTCVYIGDGRSDFCVSDKPELVFAKGKLADYCFGQDIPFVAYQTFNDLTWSLKSVIPALQGHPADILRYATA
jgi:2-hydroxy-3-keto-5-methylthiopentenyl-1-phosphate phosphatase